MMTPQTLRAARAGLNWTQERLAEEAGVHPKSVAYWERRIGQESAVPTVGAIPAMRDAFARHGVLIDGASITFPDSLGD